MEHEVIIIYKHDDVRLQIEMLCAGCKGRNHALFMMEFCEFCDVQQKTLDMEETT